VRKLSSFVLLLTPFIAQAQTTVAGAMPGTFRVTEGGAAEYRIPISVPPGLAGMEPRLALVYNSHAGNGLLGMGWDLEGLTEIARCPRTMAQDGVRGAVQFDANDRYCLDGQRLMAISGTHGADGTEYRTERESFTKVISYGTAGNGPAWFKAWTKSGQIIEYGNTADSRIEAQGKPTARVWAVNKMSDTKGNYLTVSYTEDSANGDYRADRVDYTGNASAGIAPMNAVRFTYASRPDTPIAFVSGSRIKTVSRLAGIQSMTGSVATGDYLLSYDNQSVLGRSRISSVVQCAQGNACFAPTNFTWETLPAGSLSFRGPGSDTWSSSNGGTAAETLTGDFNGDGKADIAVHVGSGYWNVCTSSGTGFNCATWYSSNGGGAANTLTGDFDGNGKTDMMVSVGNGNWNVCLSTGNGFACGIWSSNNGGDASNTAVVDLDGDGRTDMMVSVGGGNWNVCLSTGSGFGCGTWYSNNGGSKADTLFGDLDGDGRTDMLVSVGGGNWNVCLSTGAGFSCGTWSSNNGGDASNTVVADLNGDGRIDMMVPVGSGYWNVCLSLGGGGFSCGTWYSNNAGSKSTTLVGDFNHDGMADMMVSVGGGNWNVCLSDGSSFYCYTWISYNGADASQTLVGDFNGDGKADMIVPVGGGGWNVSLASGPMADLLLSVAGPGDAVSVVYKPTTNPSVYTADSGAAWPLLEVTTPAYVVSSAAIANGIGGSNSVEYKWGGLRALQTGRGSLGFRWMESTQSATELKVRSEHRQDWPFVGMPSVVRRTQSSGAVLGEASNTYGCTNPASGAACTVAAGNRYLPFASQSVETGNDLNGAALPTVTTTTAYDNFGNATSVVVSTGDGYSKITTNTFANDTASWFLGRLTRSTVQSTIP
jgi:hypothetical protein